MLSFIYIFLSYSIFNSSSFLQYLVCFSRPNSLQFAFKLPKNSKNAQFFCTKSIFPYLLTAESSVIDAKKRNVLFFHQSNLTFLSSTLFHPPFPRIFPNKNVTWLQPSHQVKHFIVLFLSRDRATSLRDEMLSLR